MWVIIHKKGLAMEAFLVSSLLCYNQWLKFFFSFSKEKRKWSYSKVRKKVVIEKVEKWKMDLYREIKKKLNKMVGRLW